MESLLFSITFNTMITEELKQAAEKYALLITWKDSNGNESKDFDTGKLEGFIAGAKWMLEHIKK